MRPSFSRLRARFRRKRNLFDFDRFERIHSNLKQSKRHRRDSNERVLGLAVHRLATEMGLDQVGVRDPVVREKVVDLYETLYRRTAQKQHFGLDELSFDSLDLQMIGQMEGLIGKRKYAKLSRRLPLISEDINRQVLEQLKEQLE